MLSRLKLVSWKTNWMSSWRPYFKTYIYSIPRIERIFLRPIFFFVYRPNCSQSYSDPLIYKKSSIHFLSLFILIAKLPAEIWIHLYTKIRCHFTVFTYSNASQIVFRVFHRIYVVFIERLWKWIKWGWSACMRVSNRFAHIHQPAQGRTYSEHLHIPMTEWLTFTETCYVTWNPRIS
jgi:hypothetical protein